MENQGFPSVALFLCCITNDLGSFKQSKTWIANKWLADSKQYPMGLEQCNIKSYRNKW